MESPIGINRSVIILLLIATILLLEHVAKSPIQAETGKGKDVFKVIMTIFGADKSDGDIVAIVTVNNGEASKVKFLDTDLLLRPINFTSSTPSTINPAESNIIEYVATFPNVTVDAGDQYKACILPVKNLKLTCASGNNSPAPRPEFVDLSLSTTNEIEQAARLQEK